MRDKSRERLAVPGPSENQATHRAALMKKNTNKTSYPYISLFIFKQLHYELEILSRDS